MTMLPEIDPETDDWSKRDPAIAFHLIDRYADNWAHTGVLMERWAKAWVAANATPKSACAEDIKDEKHD